MNRIIKDMHLVQKYSQKMSGVFSIGDLRQLFGENNPIMQYRRINALVESNILARFIRGIYTTPGFNKEVIAARIIENSYLSLGTILAKELMIGSVPEATIYAVRVGKNRRFSGLGLTIEYVGISENLFFGYKAQNGINQATREKALLDTLYFYLCGHRYSFNVFQDIDMTRIDLAIITQWLERYRNPRFVSFVKGYLDDQC
jgi:hypothetical protein